MRPSVLRGLVGSVMGRRQEFTPSEKAIQRKLLKPINQQPEFNPITHEPLDYTNSPYAFTDFIVPVYVSEFDRYKAVLDEGFQSGPNSKVEIEVAFSNRNLEYTDTWILRNRNNRQLHLYKVISIEPRHIDGMLMSFIIELEPIAGSFVESQFKL